MLEVWRKLQALVCDILPSTTAVFSYAIGPRKLSANEQFLLFVFLYNTIQFYCLCVEKFAFWLVIYIKTFNTVNNKTSNMLVRKR